MDVHQYSSRDWDDEYIIPIDPEATMAYIITRMSFDD
jgi:hypothetical protein